MINVTFKLKEPNSKTETLINAISYFDYKRFKYSTGYKVHPKLWNTENERVRVTKTFDLCHEINTHLNDIENAIPKIHAKLSNNKIKVTPEIMKIELDKHLEKNVVIEPEIKDETLLLPFITKLKEDSKHLRKPNTLKNYTSTLNHLTAYSKKYNLVLRFQDITLDFYNAFSAYLIKTQGLSNNTVGKYFKTLKSFLNEATDRGINQTFDYKKKKFKVLTEDVDKVYLTIPELNKIYKHNFKDKPHLDRVRDLFIIGCYTGLRFSDFSEIKPENIVDGNKIKIRTIKTNELVFIPLHPKIKAILKKYKNRLPEPISNQKTNDYIKDIMEDVKIKTMVETSVTKGGVLSKTTTEKFNLISTHTARRSFATNAFLNGIPSISIMKITGHKTEKSFMTYIRVTAEQNADKLLNHPFFK